MTQLFSVSIDGSSITDYVESCNVEYSLGRVINNATLTVSINPTNMNGKSVSITHGDNTFNGVVFSFSKISHLKYSIECRSYGVKLGEPYFIDEETIDFATNATELCNEYATLAGIPIAYNAIEIPFYGSWSRSSTPDNELIRLASVIGGDIYDNGDGIIIENPKPVAGTPIVINDDDVIDFVAPEKSIINRGIGKVIIKTAEADDEYGRDTEDVISRNSINVDIDEDTATADVYVTPKHIIDDFTGMYKIYSGTKVLVESTQLVEAYQFSLRGSIKSVSSVKLNGINITNYKFSQDTAIIYFKSPQNGHIIVEYSAFVDTFKLNLSKTPDGMFYNITVDSGDDHFATNGLIELKDSDNIGIIGKDDGILTYELIGGNNYVDGFTLKTTGNPKFDLYDGAEKTTLTGKVEVIRNSPFIRVTGIKIEKDDDGRYYSPFVSGGGTIQDVTSVGETIPYTTDIDVDGNTIIVFDKYYPDVEIEETMTGTRYDVQYDKKEKEQLIVLDDSIEIELTDGGGKWYDPKNFPCGYPADFPFNIPELLDIPKEDAEGVVIQGMNAPIDSKGFCYAHITYDGIYEYDVSHLKKRKKLILRANSNGSL